MPVLRKPKSKATVRRLLTRSSTSLPNVTNQAPQSRRTKSSVSHSAMAAVKKELTEDDDEPSMRSRLRSHDNNNEQHRAEKGGCRPHLSTRTRNSIADSSAISIPRKRTSMSISSGSPELGIHQSIIKIKSPSMVPKKSISIRSMTESKPGIKILASPQRIKRILKTPKVSSVAVNGSQSQQRRGRNNSEMQPDIGSLTSNRTNVNNREMSGFNRSNNSSLMINYSPRKTRSLRRQEEGGDDNDGVKCLQCHNLQPSKGIRFCPKCEAPFHLECLNLQAETIQYIDQHPKKWSCPRCISCTKCDEYIADPGNVQCTYCARAWHGECRPKRTNYPAYPYRHWVCEACKATYAADLPTPIISPPPPATPTSPKTGELSQRRSQFRSAFQSERSRALRSADQTLPGRIKWKDEEEQQVSRRQTRASLSAISKEQVSNPSKRLLPVKSEMHDRDKSVRTNSLRVHESQAGLFNMLQKRQLKVEINDDEDGEEEEDEEDAEEDEEEEESIPSTSKGRKSTVEQKPTRNLGRAKSSRHVTLLRTSPKTRKRPSALMREGGSGINGRRKFYLGSEGADIQQHDDEMDTLALQLRVLAEMGLNLEESDNNRNHRNQWIQFGQFVRYKPLYESAYQEPIQSAPIVYICEFCLTPLAHLEQFRSHVQFCPRRYPPGNEFYRNAREGWNIWEVEGNIETSYCRNLCLMAKFFLASKTLFHEVDTFTFFILTEITPRGCVIVGYFSKEKNPSKNNNLSCLLTLPSAQGRGFGKLLIDLSYQLSKLEHKIGSPEHPLSDLGLLTYRNYWRAVLFSALRKRRGSQIVSIKDLSIETAIHSYDIVSTLLSNNMLQCRNDYYYIDINKALNASLATLRRRFINPEQMLWMPAFEPNPNSKMNSYVSTD